MTEKFDDGVSWDTLGPELGDGEYTVRLFGPHEHTAWSPRYDLVCREGSPRAAARRLLTGQADLVASLPRWRVTVQAGRWTHGDEHADPPVLVATFSPHGVGC